MRQDSRRCWTRILKEIVDVGTVEKDREHFSMQGSRTRYFATENTVRDQKNKLTKQCGDLHQKKETLDLQNVGNLEQDETTSKTIQCPFCSLDLVAGTKIRSKKALLTSSLVQFARHDPKETPDATSTDRA